MTSGHDEEMARLNQVIADLKRQNAFLRGMLTDAIDLAGLAIKLDAVSEQVGAGATEEDGGEDASDDDGAWEGDRVESALGAASFKTWFKTG